MGEGFVKLYSSILDSSIWSEDLTTRICWITLLAMADADGRVHASTPGIAARARISIDEVKAALDILQAPDEHSRSQAYEGRRIMRDERDWIILNFSEHRARQVQENIKESKRRWWRENRGSTRSKLENTRSNSKSLEKTRDNAEADPDAEADKNKNKKIKKTKKPTEYSEEFLLVWKAYPNKKAKAKAFEYWANVPTDIYSQLPAIIEAQIKDRERQAAQGEFVAPWPHFSTWLNQRRWEDETTTTDDEPEIIPGVSMREQRAFEERMKQND